MTVKTDNKVTERTSLTNASTQRGARHTKAKVFAELGYNLRHRADTLVDRLECG